MPYIVADRVAELSTTEGVGAFTLLGGVAGFRSFASAMAVADTCPYFIEALDANNLPSGAYEYGRGTYSALNTLTRTTVLGSSNGGAAVNFAAGNKLVSIGVLAADMLAKGNTASLTPFALTLLDDATAAAARATLGSGATGDALFLTATAAAARQAIGFAGGVVIDRAYAEYTTNANLSIILPVDDTAPQNTEGTQILSVAITPKSVTNRLRIRFRGQVATSSAPVGIGAALFSSASASALTATHVSAGTADYAHQILLEHEYVPGVTSALTFSIRIGPGTAANIALNGTTLGRFFGGVGRATLVIEEITP